MAEARVIGRYALHGEIASGGMATVHLGRLQGPVGFGRTVAIKRLHPHFAKDPEFVQMFLDEARLAARIQHPNVVSTLDIVSEGGELWLVLDFVLGESLARLIRGAYQLKTPTPLPVVLGVVTSALYGLDAAHEARNERGEPLGMVHRDVSPQNILVGADGVARVLDFGVAKATRRSGQTRAGMLKGKVAYMPPEQLRGGTIDRRIDVYAAAVVLWETLTCYRLFDGDDDFQVANKILEAKIEPPSRLRPDVPPALDAVVLKGLAAHPDDRYPTALAMAEALESVGPVATPREIARWVDQLAGPMIRARARQVTEAESAAPPEAPASPSLLQPRPSSPIQAPVPPPAAVSSGARGPSQPAIPPPLSLMRSPAQGGPASGGSPSRIALPLPSQGAPIVSPRAVSVATTRPPVPPPPPRPPSPAAPTGARPSFLRAPGPAAPAEAKAEAPKPEAPKPEASKPEAPKPEALKVEASKPEASKVEASKVEVSKVEASKVEASTIDAPRAEARKADASRPELATAGAPRPPSPRAGGSMLAMPKPSAPRAPGSPSVLALKPSIPTPPSPSSSSAIRAIPLVPAAAPVPPAPAVAATASPGASAPADEPRQGEEAPAAQAPGAATAESHPARADEASEAPAAVAPVAAAGGAATEAANAATEVAPTTGGATTGASTAQAPTAQAAASDAAAVAGGREVGLFESAPTEAAPSGLSGPSLPAAEASLPTADASLSAAEASQAAEAGAPAAAYAAGGEPPVEAAALGWAGEEAADRSALTTSQPPVLLQEDAPTAAWSPGMLKSQAGEAVRAWEQTSDQARATAQAAQAAPVQAADEPAVSSPDPGGFSRVSSVSPEQPAQASLRAAVPWKRGAMVVGAVAALGLIAALVRSGGDSEASVAPKEASSVASAVVSAEPPPVVSAEPSPPASAAEPPPAASSAEPAVAPAPAASSAESARPRPPAKKSCNPPYTIDKRGIKRLKPECL